MNQLMIDNPKIASWLVAQTVLAQDWNASKGNLLVLSRAAKGAYQLIRAFHLGGEVEVSCDLRTYDYEEMMQYLVESR